MKNSSKLKTRYSNHSLYSKEGKLIRLLIIQRAWSNRLRIILTGRMCKRDIGSVAKKDIVLMLKPC